MYNNIGRGNGAIIVLLDLSAAFYTIDHNNNKFISFDYQIIVICIILETYEKLGIYYRIMLFFYNSMNYLNNTIILL